MVDEVATSCSSASGCAVARGGLDRAIVRRVIRAHLNEVRHCYERALQLQPALRGRVSVQLVIAPSGDVATAAVADSSVGNAEVESCIAGAARRWVFPAATDGGLTIVTYPFMLETLGRTW